MKHPCKFLLFLAILAFLPASCLKDHCEQSTSFLVYEPVYKTQDEMRQDIQWMASAELVQPGKIYVYGNYLLVNEVMKGIHVFDNSDPANPQNLGFLNIPGNVDMAVQNNYLYADNYANLATFDLGDPGKPELLNLEFDVFSLFGKTPDGKYIVDYVPTQRTMLLDCDSYYGIDVFFENGDMLVNPAVAGNPKSGSGAVSQGIAGSMARFGLSANHLYCVDQYTLRAFDLANPVKPLKKTETQVGFDIETLFPYKDKLYLGSQSGMYIYSIQDPEQPAYLSLYQHIRSCDPVFVQDDLAYVTLRGGTPCQGFENQLEVIDISDPLAPQVKKIYPMAHPHGLSVDGTSLYLCEGEYGFKTFDVSNPLNIQLFQYLKDFHAYDVIVPRKDLAIVIGADGLRQYNVSDPADCSLLSLIPVKPE